tara:strand:- start:118 stop:771 length:654 start_codon:yes stop_codon:yes gene_type:complete
MPKTKTLVKICGITTKEQAIQIAEFGTDAIGIISVAESPRFISAENKKLIFNTLEDLYPNIERVSVYKNCPIDQLIKNFLGSPNETIIQLHGDENVAYCKKIKKEIPQVGLWKAFRIKNKSDLEKVKPYEKFVDAILLDSWNEETYGGSGKKIESINLKSLRFRKPWWLAGGISMEWIDEILNDIRPDGLDISSSVEIYPGMKNLDATKNLIYKIKN